MSDDELQSYRPGRVIAGRYRITSPLSKGGMGAVYLAQQVSLGRDVALKVILERGTDPELIKRFDVEARAVCQLKHPNIITYHDYGRDDEGLPYLVMEYLAGYPGVKLVYGERRPGLLDLVHVVAQVCSALNEAHNKGIIHRDLKWSNVMVCPQSHDPYFAKLIDFGIMKVATDGSSGDQRALTRTGMLLGTPEYMSPEAICGMPIDGRADQYSLAVMLWEAVEGHRPFDAASHFELLRQQVQDAPPPFENAAQLMATYPEVERVILRGLEKHPDDRYPNIVAFQQALMESVGLAPKNPTAPPRPVKPRAQGAVGTPSFASERSARSGMPPSRARLPPAPVTGPRPVDTSHKTGRVEGDEAPPRRLHWAWLVVGFVVFLGIGFGSVMAIMGGRNSDARGAEATTDGGAIASAPSAGSAADAADATDAANAADRSDASAVAARETMAAVAATDTTPQATPETIQVAAAPETVVAAAPDTVAPDTTAPDTSTMSAGATATSAPPVAEAKGHEEAKADAKPADGDAATGNVDKPKAPAGPGHLYVQVDPWANIAIDGQTMGRAPFDGDLKPGSHTVTVTNTYFKGAYTFRVKIESGKRVARTIILEEFLDKLE